MAFCATIGGSRISDLINTFETKNVYKAESSWNGMNTKQKMFEDIEPLENPLPDWERDWERQFLKLTVIEDMKENAMDWSILSDRSNDDDFGQEKVTKTIDDQEKVTKTIDDFDQQRATETIDDTRSTDTTIAVSNQFTISSQIPDVTESTISDQSTLSSHSHDVATSAISDQSTISSHSHDVVESAISDQSTISLPWQIVMDKSDLTNIIKRVHQPDKKSLVAKPQVRPKMFSERPRRPTMKMSRRNEKQFNLFVERLRKGREDRSLHKKRG